LPDGQPQKGKKMTTMGMFTIFAAAVGELLVLGKIINLGE